METGMGYMEPPRLYQPVKHCLGYVLRQAGNHQRAAEVGRPCFLCSMLLDMPLYPCFEPNAADRCCWCLAPCMLQWYRILVESSACYIEDRQCLHRTWGMSLMLIRSS